MSSQPNNKNAEYQKAVYQQRISADPSLNAFVSANAGSGKTRVLIDRVTRILLSGTRPDKILCVTYTKAAASEMQIRLFDRLSQWAVAEDDLLTKAFQDLGLDPTDLAVERQLDSFKKSRDSEEFQNPEKSKTSETFARARQLFARALETPGGLKIQTIHAFCERLLRRFPVEAGIFPNFQILEGEKAAEVFKRVQTQFSETLLNVLRAENQEAEFVKAEKPCFEPTQKQKLWWKAYQYLITFYSRETLLKACLDALYSPETWQEDKRKALQQIFRNKTISPKTTPENYFLQNPPSEEPSSSHQKTPPMEENSGEKNMAESPEEFGQALHSLITLFCRALPVSEIKEAAICLDRTSQKGSQEKAKILFNLLEAFHQGDQQAVQKHYQSFFLTKDGKPRQKLLTNSAQKLPLVKALFDQETGTETGRVLSFLDQYKTLEAAQKTEAFYILVQAYLSLYEQEKNQQRSLDFSDLIGKTCFLLTQTSVADWVRYKLDGGLDHILVDEAQDTSPQQWQVLLAITEAFFDREKPKKRSFFAVGDEKQSIYSFQGARPEAFLKAGRAIEQKALRHRQAFKAQDLSMSFRSRPEILDFVDTLFTQTEIAGKLTQYERLTRHNAFRKKGGCVEWWPVAPRPEKEEKEGYLPPVDQSAKQSAPEKLAMALAKRIRAWLGMGNGTEGTPPQQTNPAEKEEKPQNIPYTVKTIEKPETSVLNSHISPDKTGRLMVEAEGITRPLQAGDIMILVRTRVSGNGFYNLMIKTLKRFGLPVAGSDQLKLSEHPVIEDLLSLGKAALTEQDDLSLAEVLKGPFFTFSEQDLYTLAGPVKMPELLLTETGEFSEQEKEETEQTTPKKNRNNRETTLTSKEQESPKEGAKWSRRQQPLWYCLQKGTTKSLQETAEQISQLHTQALHKGPYDFFSWFLNQNSPRGESRFRALYRRFGEECEDPLEVFLNKALEAQKQQNLSLRSFLQSFSKTREQAVKRKMDPAANLIRVMTVHAAKGLEAPVVILPDTTASSMKTQNVQLYEMANHTEVKQKKSIETEERSPKNLRATPQKAEPQIPESFPFTTPLYLVTSSASNGRSQEEETAYEQYRERQYSEYLRSFYVALTRARDHLLICGFASNKNTEESWHSLTEKAFEKLAETTPIETEFGTGIVYGKLGENNPYQTSRETGKNRDLKGETGNIPLNPQERHPDSMIHPDNSSGSFFSENFPEWVYKSIPPAPEQKQVTPSHFLEQKKSSGTSSSFPLKYRPVSAGTSILSEKKDPFFKGKILHKLLEILPETSPEKRMQKSRIFLSEQAPDLSEKVQNAWIEKILSVFEHPQGSLLFGPDSVAEKSIIGLLEIQGESLIVRGQIDRLVLLKHRVLIVDYKTDKIPPQKPEEIPEPYKRQLALYWKLMKKLYPDKQIEVYLLWTQTLSMMALSEQIMETALHI